MVVIRGDSVDFDPETHTYSYDGTIYPSVTTIIKDEWPLNTNFYSRNPGATGRGTEIHDLTAKVDRGQDSLDDYIGHKHYRELHSWKSFVDRVGAAIEVIEEPFVNVSLKYAGTVDRVMSIDGISTIVDLKSGAAARWHDLQIGAYALSLDPIPEAGYAAYIRPTGGMRMVKVDLQRAMKAWQSLMDWENTKSGEGLLQWELYRSSR